MNVSVPGVPSVGPTTTPSLDGVAKGVSHHAQSAIRAAAKALGMTPSGLVAALHRGAAVPTIAQKSGTSVAAVKTAMTDTLSQQLQAGMLSPAQYARLTRLSSELADGTISLSDYESQASDTD